MNVSEIDYTKNWIPICDVYYRKLDVCDIEWDKSINFSKMKIIAYPDGGAIALFSPQVSLRTYIPIFNSSAKHLCTITYDNGQLINVGWTNDENIILLNNKGLISEYKINGTKLDDYTISNASLIASKIFFSKNDTYIVAFTNNYDLIIRKGLNNPFDNHIKITDLLSLPICWTAFYSPRDQDCIIIINYPKDSTIVTVENYNLNPLFFIPGFEYNYFTKISISRDSSKLAIVSDTNYIWCGSVDFQNCLFETSCDLFSGIRNLEWCGNKAILYSNESQYTLQGGENDNYTYLSDGLVHFVPCIDGVNIISNKKYSFLQLVPECLVNIYMVYENPSSLLLDAYQEYKIKSYKTVELIDKLGDKLPIAIEGLIFAACHEWDTILQKTLLKAAMYGRSFHQITDKELSWNICEELRILYNLRQDEIGIKISYEQFKSYKFIDIINRLVKRNFFTLSYEICKFTNNNDAISHVLTMWAESKIKNSTKSEDDIAEEIINMLSIQPIPLNSIISASIALNKLDLAVKLVEFNSPPEIVVRTLLKVGNIKKAIKISVDSGDSNLIYSVIIYMKNNLPISEFLLYLSSNMILYALGVKFLKEFDPDKMIILLKQEDKLKNIANYQLLSTINKPISYKIQTLKQITELSKRKGILKTVTQNYIDFYQYLTDSNIYNDIINEKDISIISLISQLCKNNNLSEANKLKTLFQIPDTRFYWVALTSLAQSNLWNQIESLYDLRKNVLPASAYCDVCIEYKSSCQDLEKYLKKIPSNQKYLYYAKANFMDKAVTAAIQTNDRLIMEDMLTYLKQGLHEHFITIIQKQLNS